MATCNLCGAEGLVWLENQPKLVNSITGQEHGPGLCMVKIPLYKIVENGVPYPRKDESLARDITQAAVTLRLNPWTVQPKREGDYLIIKR